MAKRALFEPLRSIAFGDISGTYAAIGSAFAYEPRIICITNNTDADMIISDDTNVPAGKLFIAKGTYKLFDLTANINPTKDDSLVMGKGSRLYVKQVTAPSSGAVYVEVIYGQ